MFHFLYFKYVFLMFAGLCAGTVDAISGGGGLISLPALIIAGYPITIALGSNKLQASIGTSSATLQYYRNKLIKFEPILNGLFFGFLGASLGTIAAIHTHPFILEKLIPLLLFFILIYVIFAPQLGIIDTHGKMKPKLFYIIFGFSLGFYDGFFGPATGSFWIFCLIYFLGYNLAKASAYAKVFNLKSNLIALAWFIWFGHIDYGAGIIMALGQALGGFIGSKLVIRKGASFVRPIYITVITVMISVLILKSFYF